MMVMLVLVNEIGVRGSSDRVGGGFGDDSDGGDDGGCDSDGDGGGHGGLSCPPLTPVITVTLHAKAITQQL